MKLFEATPPIGFPKEVIVLNNDLADRHRDQGFYLRVQANDTEVNVVRLTGECTLPGAREASAKLGFRPTHWIETRIGVPVQFD
ncbi:MULTISPECIES: hypothetical protein [Burkholderia]|uniref:Uncharacterized protein n=2 Tax=Burkholderia cepacia complex TaxID=87882 RepID=A0AAP1V7P6_9BURK|nr:MULTISPECIES: hypothetical protein [Burkholderia]MBK1902019.1 hypothetical protein [Burkholderia contaminans]MBK1910302.1 hypothetical protein [Burkholderia contaminans]MBK1923761.1 hypothetical protein [Burkholderia contaminans]MBK1931973.1 hypothetical protein [Burkholderia contaminans]MBK1939222.1 hypothetical protein [Burkholderia contaminans]